MRTNTSGKRTDFMYKANKFIIIVEIGLMRTNTSGERTDCIYKTNRFTIKVEIGLI